MSKHLIPWFIRFTRVLLNAMPKDVPHEPSRILLLETYGVKDTVAATPAIEALRDTYPNATISLAATPASCEMLRGDSRISETIPIAVPWVFSSANRKAFLASVMRLAAKAYDIAIDLDDSPDNRLLLGLVAAPMRVGRAGLHDFALTHRDHAAPETATPADSKLKLAVKAGARSITSMPSLRLTLDDQKYVEKMLSGLRFTKRPLVAISPDAADQAARWPEAHFAELSDRISEAHPGVQVLMFGAPGANKKLEAITKKMAHLPSVLLLSVPRLAAFLERCDLYIGTHSGPTYMAAALGTPSILLYPKKMSGKAPIGPHIRLLSSAENLGELSPARVAQKAAQMLTEMPRKERIVSAREKYFRRGSPLASAKQTT